jgi:DNA-binding MarR family transcriptional regulator
MTESRIGKRELARAIMDAVPATKDGKRGVLPSDQLALVLLLEALGPVEISRIRDELGIAQATASEIVDRGAYRGYVERIPAGHDRRLNEVHLTAKAKQLRRRSREAKRARESSP